MKTLLPALVIALFQGSCATLLIRGQPELALAGNPYRVECLLEDSEYTIDNVRMEHYWGNEWRTISKDRSGSRCFYPVMMARTEDKIILSFGFMSPRQVGPYRCVLDGPNVTAPEYTEPLNVTYHYLYGPWISREGDSSLLGDTLTVKAGDNIVVNCKAASSEDPEISWYKEGDDWILPSGVLTLNNVSALDEGRYTCTTSHPTISSLSRNRTITLSVLSRLQWAMWKIKRIACLFPRHEGRRINDSVRQEKGEERKWDLDGNTETILITAGASVACLAIILSMTAFFCFCGKKIKTSKGPIDDHSAKKPIYKSSVESVPSTCGDQQPLV
ncbi:hypothetical protein NQD34_011847 [Periophthalmus magnuspinnatus]|nr:hypothetical protein NQD34_011847 [Periophthalmus magnuspinnatus]